jgi:hypothetical protein
MRDNSGTGLSLTDIPKGMGEKKRQTGRRTRHDNNSSGEEGIPCSFMFLTMFHCLKVVTAFCGDQEIMERNFGMPQEQTCTMLTLIALFFLCFSSSCVRRENHTKRPTEMAIYMT